MNDFRHGGLTRRRTGEGDKVVAHPRRSRFRSTIAASDATAHADGTRRAELKNTSLKNPELTNPDRTNEDRKNKDRKNPDLTTNDLHGTDYENEDQSRQVF